MLAPHRHRQLSRSSNRNIVAKTSKDLSFPGLKLHIFPSLPEFWVVYYYPLPEKKIWPELLFQIDTFNSKSYQMTSLLSSHGSYGTPLPYAYAPKRKEYE